MRDQALEALLARRGAVSRIATGLGISTAAVSQWRRIPPERLEEVARITEGTPQAPRPPAPHPRRPPPPPPPPSRRAPPPKGWRRWPASWRSPPRPFSRSPPPPQERPAWPPKS